MNMLNSVILEGKIKSYTIGEGFIGFVVANSRYAMNENNERIEVITEIPCRAYGVLQEVFEKSVEIGRGIRIVGHLAGSDGSVLLVCEHLEWSPKKKAKK